MGALRNGAAMEDVALASRLYQLAIESGVGVKAPLARELDFVLRLKPIAPHAPGKIIELFATAGLIAFVSRMTGALGLDAET